MSPVASDAASAPGYDQNDSRRSCFGRFLSDSLDGMNPFSPSPQAPTPGEIITTTYASYKYNQAIRYAATTASRTFGTTFLVYPNKSSTFRSILNSAQKVGAK